jgi:hypothetical protein
MADCEVSPTVAPLAVFKREDCSLVHTSRAITCQIHKTFFTARYLLVSLIEHDSTCILTPATVPGGCVCIDWLAHLSGDNWRISSIAAHNGYQAAIHSLR